MHIKISNIFNKIINFKFSMSPFFLWKVPKIHAGIGKTNLSKLKYLYQFHKLLLNINCVYILNFIL